MPVDEWSLDLSTCTCVLQTPFVKLAGMRARPCSHFAMDGLLPELQQEELHLVNQACVCGKILAMNHHKGSSFLVMPGESRSCDIMTFTYDKGHHLLCSAAAGQALASSMTDCGTPPELHCSAMHCSCSVLHTPPEQLAACLVS